MRKTLGDAAGVPGEAACRTMSAQCRRSSELVDRVVQFCS